MITYVNQSYELSQDGQKVTVHLHCTKIENDVETEIYEDLTLTENASSLKIPDAIIDARAMLHDWVTAKMVE